MPVTDAWMRRNLETEPMFGPWTTVDRRHQVREQIDPRREAAFKAPPYPAGPTAVDTYVEGDSTPAIDRTPNTHTGVRRNPGMTAADQWAQHSQSYGAEIPNTQTFSRLRKLHDRIVLFLQQDHGHPPSARDPGGRADLVRGLNAFPVNNPPKEMYEGEGWRRAYWQSRRDEHDLSIPTRHHRWRIVPRWVAATPLNRAAQDNAVQTGLQWHGLARTIKTNFDRPQMRRQPGYVGESAVTDGLNEFSTQVGEFV